MQYYRAFGLTIASELNLKPLQILNDKADVDVSISLGQVNQTGLENPTDIKPLCQQAENEHWFFVPDIARFYITNGNSIIVEPFENSDMQSVKLYLLGTCLGIIFHQRDLLVIHGNAVRFGDKAVIFAGKSGNGKSTLAAAFHQKGFDILADDLAVIDKQGLCYPSYPQLKLWQNTANKLGINTDELHRIRLQVNKYAMPLKTGFYDKPLPVAGLYILQTHKQKNIEFIPANGFEKFKPLKNQTYRKGQLEGLGLKPQHLRACTQLANIIFVTHLTRPIEGFKIDELLSAIEEDILQKKMIAKQQELTC